MSGTPITDALRAGEITERLAGMWINDRLTIDRQEREIERLREIEAAALALADGPVCVLRDDDEITDEEAMAAWNALVDLLPNRNT